MLIQYMGITYKAAATTSTKITVTFTTEAITFRLLQTSNGDGETGLHQIHTIATENCIGIRVYPTYEPFGKGFAPFIYTDYPRVVKDGQEVRLCNLRFQICYKFNRGPAHGMLQFLIPMSTFGSWNPYKSWLKFVKADPRNLWKLMYTIDEASNIPRLFRLLGANLERVEQQATRDDRSEASDSEKTLSKP